MLTNGIIFLLCLTVWWVVVLALHRRPEKSRPTVDVHLPNATMLKIATGMWIKGKSLLEIATFLTQFLAVTTSLTDEEAVKAVADFIESFSAIASTHDVLPKSVIDKL